MTKGEKVIVTIAVATLVLVVSLLFVNKSKNSSGVTAGATLSDAMQGTTTDGWTASVGSFKMLACGSGMLGTVNVLNETTGSLNLYDASTTANGAIYGTTTLTKVYASQAEGPYPMNIYFKYGLVAESQSTNVASTTITFRGNPVCQ